MSIQTNTPTTHKSTIHIAKQRSTDLTFWHQQMLNAYACVFTLMKFWIYINNSKNEKCFNNSGDFFYYEELPTEINI